MVNQLKKKLPLFVTAVAIVIIFIFILFPVYWMINSSLKANVRLYKLPPEWLPINPVFENYYSILKDGFFTVYYKNSLIVSFGATMLTMFLTMFAGYAFSRFKYKINEVLMIIILSTSMFPVVSQLISIYASFKKYGLLNTRLGLVLVTTSVSLPFCVYLIKGFFDDIPISIDEAARIDGCNRFSTLFRIIFPLIRPGFLAVGIYTFMRAWDDFQYGLTLITRDELRTLGPGISLRYLGEVQYNWGSTLAVSVSASLPILLIFIFLQKYMISGLTSGAVKG